jgi:hypothetical protein
MCSFSQPLEESTSFLSRAVVLGQRWDGFGEALVKPGDVYGAYLLEAAKLDIAGNDRRQPPIIRAA